ncbi:MAG: carbohydrate-binding domain-containing protein, partial [Lachnospiraceae bacterium]|nr:carbohydrate-binding domain-containing protein [Lachnospiraceae bacterium]
MIKQYRFLIYMLLTGTLFLAGCGSSAVETSGSDTSTTTVNSSDESAAAIEEITATSSVTTSDLTTLFSDRDYEVGYEESDAVVLTLGTNGSGSGVEVAQGDASAVTIDGDVVTITEEGTYVLSGTLTDGAIIVNAPEAKVQIVLNGVDITSADQAAIYVADADKVFVTLAAGSKNSLANGGSFTAIDDENVDAVIFSTSDLTMNGSGSLSVLSPGGHGIASKDELTVTGGTYEIEALNAGMKANDELAIADGSFTIHCSEGKGLKSETLVSVSDGTFTIVTDADDALHSDGAIMIAGGDFMISAGDDGMHADGVLSIGGGTIDITESYEGLEGLGIEIAGGEVSVVAKDDALNATNGADGDEFGFGFGGQEENLDADDASTDEESTDYSSYTAYVKISGGSLTVDAEGDGLDSNGTLEISGGDIIVYGPTMGGNGTLDYGSSATITGGTIIAFGPSSMEVNFTSDSTQG